MVNIPNAVVGSAVAAKSTLRRRSALLESVFDKLSVAPHHPHDAAAANADRLEQLKSLAQRNPTFFRAAVGAAKIDSVPLAPALQITLVNLMKYVRAHAGAAYVR